MKRKQFTAMLEAQVVQEMLKEDQTIAQLASTYEVHPTQLNHWKTQALKGLASIFERKDMTAELNAEHAKQLEEAYAEVGRLATQLAWLKKSGMDFSR